MRHILAGLILAVTLFSANATTFVTTNSTWKYLKGTAEASSPDNTAWRTNGFNDAGWLTGQSPFYYENDPGSATAYTGNTLLSDMNGNYTCVFMRQKFVVTNLATVAQLQLNALSDDGFIAWLNGKEIARFNMPAGAVAYSGSSLAALGEPVPLANYVIPDPANYLVTGTNILAVQAFNSSIAGSSDFIIWTTLDDAVNAAWSGVGISEFMATNVTDVVDVDGDHSPWIEIYNPTTAAVNLSGWSLTSDSTNLRQWNFPNVTITPQSFIIVFASGKNRTNNIAELHTNFRLAVNGGYLALVNVSGGIASVFANYPAQSPDISYGRDAATPSLTGYFPSPTPDDVNAMGGTNAAPAVTFSQSGGTFVSPFNLQLTTLSNAAIRFTLDGSLPTTDSTLYTAALPVSGSVQVRARAFLPGLMPGVLHSETYLQLDTNLSKTNSNLPAIVIYNFHAGDVPVDNDQFVNMAFYEPQNGVTRLTNAPTLNLRAGIHLHGSSTLGIPKHAFSVDFWDELNFEKNYSPLGMPAESDWILYAPDNFEPVLMHNPLAYQLSNEVGRYAPRTRFVEVYLNTTGGPLTAANYNGIYVLEEKIKWDDNRVDIAKTRSVDELHPLDNSNPNVTGGYMMKIDRLGPGESGFNSAGQTIVYDHPNEEDINTPQRLPQKQYLQSYMDAFGTALNGANYTNPTNGFRAYVDVPSWIDSHILNVATFNVDALRLSAYFYKDRNGLLTFGPVWDFDRTQGSTDGRDFNPRVWRSTDGTDFFNYTWWGRMFTDVEFWQAWIDRYQNLREGTLSTNHIFSAIDALAAQVQQQQPREAARWPSLTTPRSGSVSSAGYTYNFSGTYQGEVAFLKKWYGDRLNFMDTNFVAKAVFSNTNGLYLPGGTLTITSPTGGIIVYTTNNTDPRVAGGGISAAAKVYHHAIDLVVEHHHHGARVEQCPSQSDRREQPAFEQFMVWHHQGDLYRRDAAGHHAKSGKPRRVSRTNTGVHRAGLRQSGAELSVVFERQPAGRQDQRATVAQLDPDQSGRNLFRDRGESCRNQQRLVRPEHHSEAESRHH
ncbi:MAG: CotH kinase family protein [Limisphaerales bacterium]